jgi:hypothetical protein
LNVLTIFDYFLAPTWRQWVGWRSQQQLLQLGFIPDMQFDRAEDYTYDKRMKATRPGEPAARVLSQVRNFMAAHLKRSDPVSRRLIQYLAMQAQDLLLLVRDGKTGRFLIRPHDEECWLARNSSILEGIDDDEPDWRVTKSVGEDLLAHSAGKNVRDWQFGFTDYDDIIV